jgi:hypothetical protein
MSSGFIGSRTMIMASISSDKRGAGVVIETADLKQAL